MDKLFEILGRTAYDLFITSQQLEQQKAYSEMLQNEINNLTTQLQQVQEENQGLQRGDVNAPIGDEGCC